MDAGVLELFIERKTLGDRDILRNLTLCLKPGETVAIVGPSGRGKTTLLHIAAGLDPVFSGQRQMATKTRLAMIFQQPRLLPWRTARENLTLCHPTASPSALSEAFELVGLSGIEALFPGQMSLGMQRRLAVARALLANPHVLLADEPCASLDTDSANKIRSCLRKLTQTNGCAVVMATHDPNDIAQADRTLDLGRV